jgi:hypothetical protein
VARSLHAVINMRRDIMILCLAAVAAVLGPTALHFYHKSRSLEAQVGVLNGRLLNCQRE